MVSRPLGGMQSLSFRDLKVGILAGNNISKCNSLHTDHLSVVTI